MQATQIAQACRLKAWPAYEAHAQFCMHYHLPFSW